MQHLFGLNVLDKTKDGYLGALAELASDPMLIATENRPGSEIGGIQQPM
ncbi:hypothetical protein QFZ42_000164 [Variovorax paradoxus]|nr:hypothetical protein [Variovorax paradoxus]